MKFVDDTRSLVTSLIASLHIYYKTKTMSNLNNTVINVNIFPFSTSKADKSKRRRFNGRTTQHSVAGSGGFPPRPAAARTGHRHAGQVSSTQVSSAQVSSANEMLMNVGNNLPGGSTPSNSFSNRPPSTQDNSSAYGGVENYCPDSPGARHQSSPRPPPHSVPLQISTGAASPHSVDPFATGYNKPLTSPASSNCWEGQIDRLQCADTNGKRKLDQDEYAEQEKVRYFEQMVDDPSEHCYKAIADSSGKARKNVIFCQTTAEKSFLEQIKEGHLNLKEIKEELKWMEQDHLQQMQELEHNFCVQKQSLIGVHDNTASRVDELERKHDHFSTEIQPVMGAMTDPISNLPNCFYGLDSTMQELVYSVRLGDTARTCSLHDIRVKMGLPDNVSCLKLSLKHVVSVIQALNRAGLASNSMCANHIKDMKESKYDIQCFAAILYISFNNSSIPVDTS